MSKQQSRKKKLFIDKKKILKSFSTICTYWMKSNFVNKKWENHHTLFNQVHYEKIAYIVGIFAISRLVSFSCLIMHFSCGHNVCIFARGNCT